MLYDKDIREPLFEFLEETYGKIRIIEEKKIGKTRADVMMITPDSIWGIEIKSDADTYTRLERQVKDYNRIFDYNCVAVGSSHGLHVAEHVPEYWGIITIDEIEGRPDFYILRKPQPNPKREKKVKFRNQISLLWRPELAHIQELNDMPKYAQKSKAWVIEKITEMVDEERLKSQICDELFERDYNAIADKINEYRKSKGKRKKRASKKGRKE